MEIDKGNKMKDIVDTILNNISTIASCDTILGSPITLSNGALIPVCKVVAGYALGGGEMKTNYKGKDPINFPVAMTTGGGVNITPIGFILDINGEVKYIKANEETRDIEKLLDVFNKVISLINGARKHE